jgi:rod shape-determining protein MreB
MAAAMGAGIDVEAPQASMVVDIGGGTTEVAIISTCSVAHFESIRIAGDAMDEAIVRYLRRAMHLEITRRLGEEIKIRIGCAIPPSEVQRVTLKAKEAGRGGLRTVELTSVHTSEALEKPVDAIIDCVRRVLEDAPPALLSDALEGGMVLTGGGSLLPGFEELMSRMLGIRVSKADDPMASVVRGCGMAIEDPQRWQRIFVT